MRRLLFLLIVIASCESSSLKPPADFVTNAGFTDAGITGAWRDSGMNRVPYRVFVKHASASDTVSVPGSTRDYVVLVRPGS